MIVCLFWSSHLFGVDATVVGHIPLAPFVHIQLAHRTLQSLIDQPVEHGAAMITEGEPLVGVNLEAVGDVDVEAAKSLLNRTIRC